MITWDRMSDVITVTAARYDTLLNAIAHKGHEGYVKSGTMVHKDNVFMQEMKRIKD